MTVPNYEHKYPRIWIRMDQFEWTNLKSKPELQKLRLEFDERLNREVEFLIRDPRIEFSTGMKDLTVKYWYLRKQ